MKRIINPVLVPLATVLILAGTIIALCYIVPSRDAPLSHDELFHNVTKSEMSSFGSTLTVWAITKESVPGPSFADAVTAMQSDEHFRERLSRLCPHIITGRDAWGNGLIYEVSADKKSAVIRSIGPDRKDDHGSGDDIQIIVHVR